MRYNESLVVKKKLLDPKPDYHSDLVDYIVLGLYTYIYLYVKG